MLFVFFFKQKTAYEIRSAVRFSEQDGRPAFYVGMVEREGETLAKLTYGHAATLWRINLGWMRRKNKDLYGFVLDTERGYWAKSGQSADDPDAPMLPRTSGGIPYVENRRNRLLFEPVEP